MEESWRWERSSFTVEQILTMLRQGPQRIAAATMGKPLERTVLYYAHWMATHERPHVRQIEGIVNKWSSG